MKDPVSRIEWHVARNKGLRGRTISLSATIGDRRKDGELPIGVSTAPLRPDRLTPARIDALLKRLQRRVLERWAQYNGEK